MAPLRQRMVEGMQLRGLSEKTQEAYVYAVRQLAEHYGKSPDRIDEEELRQCFLYLKNDKQASGSTLNGIEFLKSTLVIFILLALNLGDELFDPSLLGLDHRRAVVEHRIHEGG